MRYPNLGVHRTAVESWTGKVTEHDHSRSLWKVIRYFDPSVREVQPDDEWLLFNLSEDATEENNLQDTREATVFSRWKDQWADRH